VVRAASFQFAVFRKTNMQPMAQRTWIIWIVIAIALAGFAPEARAAVGPEASVPLTAPEPPGLAASLTRVFGAMLLVLALFLGGVWLARNWQRVALQRSGMSRLKVLEARSL
jgi:hypothetical protein